MSQDPARRPNDSSRMGMGMGRPQGMRMGMGPGMGMALPGDKPKNFKETFNRLVKYLKPHRLRLVLVFAAAVISTVFSIMSPKILGHATDILFSGMVAKLQGQQGAAINFSGILHILEELILLYIVSFIFSYIQQLLMAEVAQRTVYQLRKDVNAKLQRLPLKFFDSRPNGEILSRVVNDVDNISNTSAAEFDPASWKSINNYADRVLL